MELKKSPKADLESSKTIYTLVGLVFAMLLTVGLFAWNQPTKVITEMAVVEKQIDADVVEVTVQEETPPVAAAAVAPIAISDMIQIVKNDAKIDSKIDFLTDENLTNEPIVTKKFEKKKEEAIDDDNVVLIIADKMAKFQGEADAGTAFRRWVQKDLAYPQVAIDNGASGTVTVEFVIEKDGSVTNVKVLRGVDRDLDAVAVKKIQSSPKWTAGENRGKPCKLKYTIPVTFKIQ